MGHERTAGSNFKGQKAPLNQPSENADFDSDFKPGLWYNMPKVHNSHTLLDRP